MSEPLSKFVLARYGLLGIPLAFAGLPLYIHLPQYYSSILGMNLALLGTILLVTRLGDCFIDPLLGYISDRYGAHRLTFMAISLAILSISYALLFHPPAGPLTLWLAVMLMIVYTSYIMLLINYYALGVGMAQQNADHSTLSAVREGCILIGVIIACALPSILTSYFGQASSYAIYSIIFIPIALICGTVMLTNRYNLTAQPNDTPTLKILLDTQLLRLLGLLFLNTLPVAITSTLFLFFVSDILQAAQSSGLFLIVYFAAAACSTPLWLTLSRYIGRKHSLVLGMLIVLAAFIWSFLLKSGDSTSFTIICIITGMGLGADITMLPALFSSLLSAKKQGGGLGFGTWNFINKLTLAIAAGFVLPLLSHYGYHPGTLSSPAAFYALRCCYALLPCLLKAIALVCLMLTPFPKEIL